MLLPDLGAPTEGIVHTENPTECFVNERSMGLGVLYVAQSRLCWTKENSNSGLSLEYPHVAIHAVCRDLSKFPQKQHIYIMVDTELFPEDRADDSDDDEDNDPEPKCTSVLFVPAADDNLETIYRSISTCQQLHPEEEGQESDNEPPEYDDEDEGEYDINDGPLPALRYQDQQQYEDTMENGLGDAVAGNGYSANGSNGYHDNGEGGENEDEAMEQDQFQDS